VLAFCHCDEVVRATASSHLAEVVNLAVVRDRPDGQFIRHAMRVDFAPVEP